MIKEIEKTCENCEYEYEDIEGTHCRHCIHNAEEHFEPKTSIVEEQEIRNKAIDEFAERVITQYHQLPTTLGYTEQIIREIAEQLKAGVV